MQSIIKFFSATLLLMLISMLSYAHTLWLEVAPKGTAKQEQTTKVYFGEFYGSPSKANKWFSNLSEVKVYLTAPDGSITEVTNKSQSENSLDFTFTPQKNGVYKFSFAHVVKDVFRGMKITYASASYIVVGDVKATSVNIGDQKHQLVWKNANDLKQLQIFEDQQPLANASLKIEKKGEDLAVYAKTDDKGMVIFPSDWKGDFLLELVDSKEVSGLTHFEKPYENDYKVFSYHFSL